MWQSLSTEELDKLGQLLDSDYWQKNRRIRQLGRWLLGYGPAFTSPKLTREAAWRQVAAGTPYVDQKLNNLLSDLLQFTYDFLALESLRRDDHTREAYIQEALLQRRLYPQADRTARRWRKRQEQVPEQDEELFYATYRWEQYRDLRRVKGAERSFDPHLQAQSTALDHFYTLSQLSIYCEMLNRGQIVQSGYEQPYLPEILARLEAADQPLREVPLARIYQALIRMLTEEPAEPHYEQAKALLFQSTEAISPTRRKSLYAYLINFAVRQINRGQPAYYQEAFEIYQRLTDESLLLEEGRLSQWTFTNIVTLSVRMGAYDWARNFMDTYHRALPAAERETVYQYNLASLHFQTEDYAQALRHLHVLQFTKDDFYQMATKILQLKCFYQLGEYEAMRALASTTRQYLVRNRQLSDYQRQANLQFVRAIRALASLREQARRISPDKRRQKAKVIEERLNVKTISNKAWLLQAWQRLREEVPGA
ncbi:MAG: hypothetical protein KDC54_16990 [Lewinella sp.]|nr:hypothetical protein [Lewinella sp.]